jgi:mevalonate pyrophosphate decarboxylase
VNEKRRSIEMLQNKDYGNIKASEPSSHLSQEENNLVFKLIGRRSQSQCTTIAQLFQTEAPHYRQWAKKCTGALCFIKDSEKRSYFMRMYCLIKHDMLWEQEVYDNMDIRRVKPFLITFEGQVGNIAI